MIARKVFVSAILLTAWVAAAAAAGPKIRFDKDTHNYGNVLYGDRVLEKFQFSNTGDETLVVDKLRASCGCTRVEAEPREVPPGGKGAIVAELDTVGLSQGAKQKTIMVHSNDATRPIVKLTLIAHVERQVTVTPAFLAHKSAAFVETISFPMKISNNSDRPVTVAGLEVKGAGVAGTLLPSRVVVQPAREAPFTIEMSLVEQKGRYFYAGNVVLRTDHPREQETIMRYFVQVGETK